MGKKMDIIVNGVELLVAIGVSTLVGGALVMVKPAKLGVIKKIAVGVGGAAVSCMATDGVVKYVDHELRIVTNKIQEFFKKKPEEDETEEDGEA